MHRGQSTEFDYVLYTKEKCVTIRVTCTFTLNITSSNQKLHDLACTVYSIHCHILYQRQWRKWNFKFSKHTFFQMKQNNRFFFLEQPPSPQLKKTQRPTYICAHIIWFVSTMQLLIWQHYSASVTHTHLVDTHFLLVNNS